jgi:hypothetical protein
MGAVSRAAARVRAWVRTNILGRKSHAMVVLDELGPPPSTDDNLRSVMEETKFMPPEPIGEDGRVNDKFVGFLADKLVDFIVGLIGAGFAWLFFRVTGRRLIPEATEHNRQLAETIVPAAIWLICFLGLTYRRILHPSKKQ